MDTKDLLRTNENDIFYREQQNDDDDDMGVKQGPRMTINPRGAQQRIPSPSLRRPNPDPPPICNANAPIRPPVPDPMTTTRSGRVSKPPGYLKDFAC